MGPLSLVARHRQKLDLSLLFHWLAWERNWVQTRGSVGRCVGDYVGSPFLVSSWIHPNLSMTRERLLCVDHVRYVWSETIRRLSMGCVWCVGRIFPYRVYIDLNHYNSRIWVPLICGSHHVDNLMNLISLYVIDVCCLLHLITWNSCLSRVGCNLLRNDLNRAKTWK
jgi:hypothetical protein